MDKEIIKVLRNRSFIDGKERTWISELTDKQLWDITIKVINREPLTEIAKDLKKRGWTKSESSVRSISQGISKYSNRIADVLIYAKEQVMVGAQQIHDRLGHLLGGCLGLSKLIPPCRIFENLEWAHSGE